MKIFSTLLTKNRKPLIPPKYNIEFQELLEYFLWMVVSIAIIALILSVVVYVVLLFVAS